MLLSALTEPVIVPVMSVPIRTSPTALSSLIDAVTAAVPDWLFSRLVVSAALRVVDEVLTVLVSGADAVPVIDVSEVTDRRFVAVVPVADATPMLLSVDRTPATLPEVVIVNCGEARFASTAPVCA